MSDATAPDTEQLLLSWYRDEWAGGPHSHLLRGHLFQGQREACVLTWPLAIDDVGRGNLHAATAYTLCRSGVDRAFVVEVGPVPDREAYPRARGWAAVSHLRPGRQGVTNFYQLCPGVEPDELVALFAMARDDDHTPEAMLVGLPQMISLWADDHLALMAPKPKVASGEGTDAPLPDAST